MQLFVSWSLSVYKLNQVACFMQNLFTNCSHQNGESWQWRHYHPCLSFAICCWNSAIQRDISHNSVSCSYKWWRLSFCSFDQIASLLFPLSSHILFTMCWLCAFICWWCCNLLTSKPRSLIGQRSNVSWSLMYRIEHVLSQSVYHATSKSCMIQSNSTVYTVFFCLW